MKLSFKKKNLENKEITNKEITNKEIIMKKFLNKKVISVICILLVIALGFTIYKVKFAKKAKIQSNVKYTTLQKTNISTTISSSGAIKSGDSTNVYSNFDYKVASISVEVGDVVKKGDVLAVIDTTDLEDTIAKLQLSVTSSEEKNKIALATAKVKYDNLQYLYDNNLNTDIINAEKAADAAQNSVDEAQLALQDTNKTYEYDKVMLQNGAVSQDTVDKAKIEYEKAQNTCENAQGTCDKATVALEAAKVTADQSLATAKNDYDSDQAAVADTSSRLELENDQAKLKNREVVAPVDGTVTNVNAVVGIESSGALFVIQDLSNLIVNASVDETDVANVKVGQRVEITTDASGTDIIAGKVLSVEPVSSTASASNSSTTSSTSSSKSSSTTSTTSNSTSSDVTFNVKVQLTDQNDKVKVGMNSVVNIITDEKNDIYAVPYGAVVNNDGKSEVYAAVKQDKQYTVKEIPVTKGIESAANVEIEGSDLSDGMIIISDPSNYSVGSNVTISDEKTSRKQNK